MADNIRLSLTVHTTLLDGDLVLVELNRDRARGETLILPLEPLPEPWETPTWEAPDVG